MLDAIVDRREIRDYVTKALNFMMNPEIAREPGADEPAKPLQG
jgi:hypothetical protein